MNIVNNVHQTFMPTHSVARERSSQVTQGVCDICCLKAEFMGQTPFLGKAVRAAFLEDWDLKSDTEITCV